MALLVGHLSGAKSDARSDAWNLCVYTQNETCMYISLHAYVLLKLKFVVQCFYYKFEVKRSSQYENLDDIILTDFRKVCQSCRWHYTVIFLYFLSSRQHEHQSARGLFYSVSCMYYTVQIWIYYNIYILFLFFCLEPASGQKLDQLPKTLKGPGCGAKGLHKSGGRLERGSSNEQ